MTLTIGHDGWRLLAAIDHAEAPAWLREVPAVAVLRRVWMQNSLWDGSQLGALLKGVEKVSELRDVSFPSKLHRISAQHRLALT